MVSAFLNSVKIPELRRRILFTLAVIVIVRLGAAITTPGVNQAVLQEWFRSALTEKSGGSVAALFNLFSGGALENCAIFSLGIMPYISASIMMQLLTAVIPQLSRLAREDGGRQKIMQLTRYATVGLCIFQGYLLAVSFQHPESYHTMLPGITDTIRNLGVPLVDDPGWTFRIVTVISLTTGTLFLMWLGDQITERGVGNGTPNPSPDLSATPRVCPRPWRKRGKPLCLQRKPGPARSIQPSLCSWLRFCLSSSRQ